MSFLKYSSKQICSRSRKRRFFGAALRFVGVSRWRGRDHLDLFRDPLVFGLFGSWRTVLCCFCRCRARRSVQLVRARLARKADLSRAAAPQADTFGSSAPCHTLSPSVDSVFRQPGPFVRGGWLSGGTWR